MKKTRILAALLCLMMVICSLPMVASAAVPANIYNAIGKLMGTVSSVPTDDPTWFGMNFDFTDNFNQTANITMPAGASYDNINGLNMPKGTYSTWRYNPRPAGWSPLVFGAYYIRFKVESGGRVEAVCAPYYQHARAFVIATETGVTVFSSADDATIGSGQSVVANLVDYKPGTEWNNMVVVANGGKTNAANGYSVYMKKDSDATFTKVASTNSYRAGGNAWKGTGMEINGNDSYVSDLVMLSGSDTLIPDFGGLDTTEIGVPKAAELNAAGQILGAASIKTTAAAAGNAVFEFTENAGQTSYAGAVIDTGSVTYTNGGMKLGPTASQWRYQPVAKWCPFSYGSIAYTKLMVAEGGSIMGKFYQPTSIHGYVSFTLTPDSVTFKGGEGNVTNAVDCTPGTGWVEIMLDRKTTSQMDWYMKGGSLTEWTKMGTSTSWISGSNNVGITFYGSNAIVNYAAIVEPSNVAAVDPVFCNSIEEIVGGAYATNYNFEFDQNFAENLEVSATEGIHQKASAAGDTAGTYTANGWSGNQWQFLPYAGWEVLSNTSFLTFTAKTGSSFNFQTRGVGGGQLYIDFNKTGANYYRDANPTFSQTVAPGTDWAEYLIKKSSTTNGYEVFMKQDAATGGKWQKIVTTANFRTATNGVGITITPGDTNKANTWIKNVRVHSTNVVADNASKPAGATELMFGEEFAAAPAYGNPDGSGISYADGNMVLTENDETEVKAYIFNTEIPVGGYAEFRLNVGATEPTITFYDGTGSVAIYNRPNYGVIYDSGKGVTATVGDGNTSYRTWRVVRNTANTFSFYTKADFDNAWYKVAENVTAKSVGNSKHIFISGTKAYGGAAGVAKVDYFNVYGPAINDALTLTDGYGTVIPAEGAKLSFPQAVRAIVKANSGKILVATYAGNDMLKAQIVDVASMDGTNAFVNAKVSGGNKIKVFYWDSFSKMNTLKSVATFSY